ncbi:MAG: hypothetical protein V7459_09270 [Oceanicoccus sp.]
MVIAATYESWWRRLLNKRKALLWVIALSVAIWAALFPQRFISLWLTPDQQGRALFELGYYTEASQHFQTPLWKGVSLYAAESFETAAMLFSQYQDHNGQFAKANALAHSRNYVQSVAVYDQMLEKTPTDTDIINNRVIVKKLLDENQLMSESQQAEAGEMFLDSEDGPKSSEGDERQMFDAQPEQQLSSDQLLGDPALIDMWMRQVQKDPTQFLKVKFYMQLEQQAEDSVNEGGAE